VAVTPDRHRNHNQYSRPIVYHLQLRMRPQIAHVFNLSAEELTARFLAPLVNGRDLVYEGLEWTARKTTVTVYEGPELGVEQLGIGRGWGNAQRSGTDVTERILEHTRERVARHPALDPLQERLSGRLSAGPMELRGVIALADDLLGGRVSERLAVAEQAVWEMLYREKVGLVVDGTAVLDRDRARELLLVADSWFGDGVWIESRSPAT
jgi:hypothetical protein